MNFCFKKLTEMNFDKEDYDFTLLLLVLSGVTNLSNIQPKSR